MDTVMEFYVSEKTRRNVIKELTKYFVPKACPIIEAGIYDYSEQFCASDPDNFVMGKAIYDSCARNLLFNCEQDHRTIREIRDKIEKGEYNPYNLSFLRADEIDEDNWMKIILRRNTTEDKLKNLPTIEWRPCRVCKKTEFFYHQLQTRSADEPVTTFYICKSCNKTYRVNN